MKKQYKILLLFIMFPFVAFSTENDFNYSKQKNINKAYYVNSDATLYIDNSYGNISVTTWNENIIELDISIKVSGDNENWVNQRINDINIDINALKGIISAKTILGNSSSKNKGRNNSFEINYTLKIPKNASVKLNNKYGNISTTDLYSLAEINCKYGKINLGKLFSTSAIQIDYCSNSSIDFFKYGSINAKYSNLKINQVGKIDLISDYTDVEIIESDVVKYNSKYGKIKIKNVQSLDASGNYLTIRIGEVFNQLKLNTKYSSLKIETINDKANSINIISGYTGIDIGYDSNFAFDFTIDLKYANFNHSNELEINSKEEISNSKKYMGFYKKKGINNITIISDYGNVSLTNNH
ncbi:hypothetical protein [Flavobacterium sp. GP15]|uniref:hypothetical protein n=1 Tax=Flavobacterium sp. GP15 TaxID=2758567 RepID=UPI00165DB089|nr:hypothetical protein [Flavobacterium sp. GP15]